MKRWLKAFSIALFLLAAFLLALYWPIRYQPPVNARPAAGYEEAESRIARIIATDQAASLYPGCASRFLSHGQKTARAIVLLHGYRNCPKQYQQLGETLFASGYNVLIPRMPHMGLADVMTGEQANLTADELAAYTTEAVDIAQGLGDEVIVAGISTGGVLTGWVAQTRTDVDRAVLIAPVFGLYAIPAQLTRPAANLFLALPNFLLWQDAELKADVPNPPHVYPQNATRAIGEILKMSFAVQAMARSAKPTVNSIRVVTNANDDAVDDRITEAVIANWRSQGLSNLEHYEFETGLALDHDMLDPEHPKQRIEVAYPVLIDMISKD
jgi:carboxylesterase